MSMYVSCKRTYPCINIVIFLGLYLYTIRWIALDIVEVVKYFDNNQMDMPLKVPIG